MKSLDNSWNFLASSSQTMFTAAIGTVADFSTSARRLVLEILCHRAEGRV
jgi:hypothetical protein